MIYDDENGEQKVKTRLKTIFTTERERERERVKILEVKHVVQKNFGKFQNRKISLVKPVSKKMVNARNMIKLVISEILKLFSL